MAVESMISRQGYIALINRYRQLLILNKALIVQVAANLMMRVVNDIPILVSQILHQSIISAGILNLWRLIMENQLFCVEI